MNYNYQRHLISTKATTKMALSKLNDLAPDAILFVTDGHDRLLGSLTDGDIRRGLLRGFNITDSVDQFIQTDPKFVQKGKYDISEIIEYREKEYKVLPVVDQNNIIVNVINFRFLRSYLPVDAVVMAGGRGERLRPLTDHTPKPLLTVGRKAIIQHNVDRLKSFGIDDLWITVRYLGDKIKDHFEVQQDAGVNIRFIDEDSPLGTIGAISLIEDFQHNYVLITNSDVLTNLDYENFFLDFLKSDADFSVVAIPYDVSIPYAILETSDSLITSFKEKPTYTYFANAGIYLMKREICEKIPKGEFYNATDLLHHLIEKDYKVTSYSLRGYWLDIGRHEDYKKAQDDINHVKF